MPNIKSSKTDVISSKIAYETNKANKSALKTTLKKFDAALESGVKADAEVAYKASVKAIDQAVNKGLTAQEQRCPQEERYDSEAEQAGLISLKISPSEFSLEGVFSCHFYLFHLKQKCSIINTSPLFRSFICVFCLTASCLPTKTLSAL